MWWYAVGMAKQFPIKPVAGQEVESTIIVPAQAGWGSPIMHYAQLPPRTALALLHLSEKEQISFDNIVDKFMESEFDSVWFEDVLERVNLYEIALWARGVREVNDVIQAVGMLSPDEIDTLDNFQQLLDHLRK
jgi:hypothetical protein